MRSTKWKATQSRTFLGHVAQVALVAGGEDHLAPAGAVGGPDLLLDAADLQDLAAEGDLAAHGDVVADGAVGESAGEWPGRDRKLGAEGHTILGTRWQPVFYGNGGRAIAYRTSEDHISLANYSIHRYNNDESQPNASSN
jgi:hypothetical protein